MSTLIPAQIAKANRSLRRWFTWFSLSLFTLSWTLIHGAERYAEWLQQTVGKHPHASLSQASALLVVVATLMAISLIAFSGWMGIIALKSFQKNAYPPIKSMILRDTAVVSGWRAQVKAGSAFILFLFSGLSAIGVMHQIHAFLVAA